VGAEAASFLDFLTTVLAASHVPSAKEMFEFLMKDKLSVVSHQFFVFN
jgi:hypothetical protein